MAALPILLALVMAIGLIAAIFLGRAVANEQVKLIAAFYGAVILIAICLKYDTKVWLLIPTCWLLGGKISVLPLPLSVHDLSVLLAVTVFTATYIFKRASSMGRWGRNDIFLYINLVYLATVYLRNPVGTQALGSEMVGGRPYLDVLIAVLGYWVVQHVTLTEYQARRLPYRMSIGAVLVSALSMLTMRVPSLVPIIAPFYSGISIDSYLREQNSDISVQSSEDYRLTSLQTFGQVVGTALVSYFPPIRLLLLQPFLRVYLLFDFIPVLYSPALLYYLSFIATLLAGYRSGFVLFAILASMSSYFYGGVKDLMRISMAVILAVAGIILLQSTGFNVHPAIQRSLSFLPGDWDPGVVAAAEGSSEWRFEMWRIALEGNRYIKNKILGDGFGFSAYELQIQLAAMWGGAGYIGANGAEAQLVTGAYHSGPISAIRYVGVVGLILFTVLLISMAFYAWKIIKRAKGTYLFPLALFIGMPAIYKPIEFWFVFGGYNGDLPAAIFSLSMLNLTSRALNNYETNQQDESDAPTISVAPKTPAPKEAQQGSLQNIPDASR